MIFVKPVAISIQKRIETGIDEELRW